MRHGPIDIEVSLRQQGLTEGQTFGIVVIAGDKDYRDIMFLNKTGKDFIQQGNGLCRRDCAVIDVTGNQYGVDFTLYCQVDKLCENHGLFLRHMQAVEYTAQVPV